MNFQIVLSIALLATLAATTQGLFVKSAIIKKKLLAASSLAPVVGQVATGVSEVPELPVVLPDIELPIEPAVVEEDIHSVFNPRYSTVPVYSYAPLYHSRVYYTAVRPAVRRTVYARANFGGSGRPVGNLVSGAVKAIGDLGASIKGALSSAVPSTIQASVTTY